MLCWTTYLHFYLLNLIIYIISLCIQCFVNSILVIIVVNIVICLAVFSSLYPVVSVLSKK